MEHEGHTWSDGQAGHRLFCFIIARTAIARRRIRISQEWMNIGVVDVSLESPCGLEVWQIDDSE
jgi:hypothetical protein